MEEVLGAIAALVAIVGGAATVVRWLWKKVQARKSLKAQRSVAALPPAPPPYPVRLICREDNDFHPSSGYHEGLFFEVSNESDKPVTIKGFGFEITLRTQADWQEHEQARHAPPYDFPVRLAPNDGLDGYIDTEWLADDLFTRGMDKHVVQWRPYVDVVGYGKKTVDIEKDSA